MDRVLSFNKENTKCSDEVKYGLRADGGRMLESCPTSFSLLLLQASFFYFIFWLEAIADLNCCLSYMY